MTADRMQELEQWVDDRIAAGADVADVIAALEALDASGGETQDEAQTEQHKATLGGFRIKDRAADPVAARNLAQWALGKYRRAITAQDEVNAFVDAQKAQIEEYRKAQCEKHEKSAAFFASVLDQYQADFGGGERTVKLIGGALKLTKNRVAISWQNDLAEAWALAQPDVDELAPRKWSKAAVKSRLISREDGSFILADSGEVVDFVCNVEPEERDSFKVVLE